jgi:hypothetical protein
MNTQKKRKRRTQREIEADFWRDMIKKFEQDYPTHRSLFNPAFIERAESDKQKIQVIPYPAYGSPGMSVRMLLNALAKEFLSPTLPVPEPYTLSFCHEEGAPPHNITFTMDVKLTLRQLSRLTGYLYRNQEAFEDHVTELRMMRIESLTNDMKCIGSTSFIEAWTVEGDEDHEDQSLVGIRLGRDFKTWLVEAEEPQVFSLG